MILVNCGLLLMFLSCVWTKEYVYDYGLENAVTSVEQRYSFWPSMHNALLRKRDVTHGNESSSAITEGGGDVSHHLPPASPVADPPSPGEVNQPVAPQITPQSINVKPNVEFMSNVVPKVTNESLASVATSHNNSTNATVAKVAAKQFDLHNPGVLMRGVIVFGGFLLLAVMYYIFYKTKGTKNETGNTHNMNDTNQFRYGVLHSDDRRGNLELSRVPLTMESDEDEDEDLEIFNLGQKKQSLSYVNLQTNDEDIVFNKSTENGSNDKDNLLLDIEDVSTDPLINWSHNGNKSIL